MKRSIIYVFLIILSAVSCRKEPVMTDNTAAISFAAPDVIPTKSILIKDIKDMKSGNNELAISVFASRYIPGANGEITNHGQFMNDVKVKSTDNGATWTYEGEYHWSPGAVHKFFAVYPYYDTVSDTYDLGLSFAINETEHAVQMTGKHEITETVDGNSVTKKVICTGTDNNGVNLCTDILYGVRTYDVPYALGEDRGPVEFSMNHALAAVSFRLRNASEYTITGITTTPISGFKNGSEYLLLSERGPEWKEPLFEITDHGHSFEVPAVTTAINSGTYYEPDGKTYWYTALMIPQNFGLYATSPQFRFTVTMQTAGTKTYTIDFKDYAVSEVAEYGFTYRPGYHYVYNLNVTSRIVSCDVEVVPWIEDEPIKLN